MEDQQEGEYEVIITAPAEIYFYQILDYLYDHYPIDRAEEVANEIRDKAKDLAYLSNRGAIEPRLKHLKKGHRFLLYKRTPYADIKIIHYCNEPLKQVYVTDFFPTEMDHSQIADRNI